MRVLALAGDAGGARALLPVIRRLQRAPAVSVACRAYAAAQVIWQDAGLAPGPVEPVSLDGVQRVLLGTSEQPQPWELKYIAQAEQQDVQTLSVLDHWQHYRERFTDGEALILPTLISVMDERAKTEMLAAGFPEERLAVTGQPALDEVDAYRGSAQRVRAQHALAQRVGADAGERLIVFASQPLSMLQRAQQIGFHERDVLAQLVDALGRVLDRHGARAVLIVKPHPREAGQTMWLPLSSSPRLRLAVMDGPFASPLPLVAGCDLVTGMHSLLLLEACLLGRPVVSYQPGLKIADPLRSNEWGWSRAVTQPEALERALEEELFDAEARQRRQHVLDAIHLPGGAAERVAELVMSKARAAC